MAKQSSNDSAKNQTYHPQGKARPLKQEDGTYAAIQIAKQAKNTYENELIARKDVVAVAVGFRSVDGEQTDEPSVKVFVEKKLPLAQLPKANVLPRSFSLAGTIEVPVDVEEMQPPTSPPLNTAFTLRDAASFISMASFGLWQPFRPAFV